MYVSVQTKNIVRTGQRANVGQCLTNNIVRIGQRANVGQCSDEEHCAYRTESQCRSVFRPIALCISDREPELENI